MPKLIRITTVHLSLKLLLTDQMKFMKTAGWDVLMVSSDGREVNEVVKREGCPHHVIPFTRKITPFQDLYCIWLLIKLFKEERPDIVHTHTPKAGILGMLAAKMAGVPVRLHTVAGLPLMEASGAKRHLLDAVEKLTYACATKVYPNSIGLRNIILENNYAPPQKLKVLGEGSSNGIDTKYFDPGLFSDIEKAQFRKKLRLPLDDLVFIFVGRLVADKGINELVEAFVELQKTEKSVSLLLVGPFEQELDPIMDNNLKIIKTHPKIVSVGFQEDVRPYLAVADVLAFPSYREGFPNVVLQAGAMGLPAIVSDINGCNEIVAENVNGCIIPVKDKIALKGAMQRLFKETSLREKLCSNSRSLVTKSYERKGFWKLLVEEYQYWGKQSEMDRLKSSS